MKVKTCRAKRQQRLMRKGFRVLSIYSLKKISLRYQEAKLMDRYHAHVYAKVFTAIKYLTSKQSRLREAQKQTEFNHEMKLKAACLSSWAMQWMKLEKTRRQESLSQKMHDERFLKTYLRAWVNRKRKTVLKRNLYGLAKVIDTEKRNRIFLKWLCAVKHNAITEELS